MRWLINRRTELKWEVRVKMPSVIYILPLAHVLGIYHSDIHVRQVTNVTCMEMDSIFLFHNLICCRYIVLGSRGLLCGLLEMGIEKLRRVVLPNYLARRKWLGIKVPFRSFSSSGANALNHTHTHTPLVTHIYMLSPVWIKIWHQENTFHRIYILQTPSKI